MERFSSAVFVSGARNLANMPNYSHTDHHLMGLRTKHKSMKSKEKKPSFRKIDAALEKTGLDPAYELARLAKSERYIKSHPHIHVGILTELAERDEPKKQVIEHGVDDELADILRDIDGGSVGLPVIPKPRKSTKTTKK